MSSVRAGLTEPLQQLESLRSIHCLLSDGGRNWFDHLNWCASSALSAFRLLYLTDSWMKRVPASTTLGAAFGINANAPELNEAMLVRHTLIFFPLPQLTADADRPSENWQSCARRTASIINIFPFLDWIPGPMPWRTRAKAYRKHEDELYERLVREAVSGEKLRHEHVRPQVTQR